MSNTVSPHAHDDNLSSYRILQGKQKITIADRFWSKVDKSGECWLWTTAVTRAGYGKFGPHPGEAVHAHRFVWILTYGAIPDGLLVCHHCDNRLCVRPDHLFLGTSADNNQDCAAKGRNIMQTHPERASQQKLTDEQVREIRQLYASGEMSQYALARRYGVTQANISCIVHYKSWGWLT